jgi:hypothetical protein
VELIVKKLGIFIDGVKTKLSYDEVERRISEGYYDGHSVMLYTNCMISDLMAKRFLQRIKNFK